VDGSAQLDEPLKDLVSLLSKLTGKHGEVNIPGFYDPIPDLSAEEERLYIDITQSLVARNPGLGDPQELAYSLMRRWREASLTIHKFQTSGPDNATIIPRLASAAISVRLVPNQEADDVALALKTFLKSEFRKLGSHNKLKVTIDHQAEPWLGDLNNQIFQTLEDAITTVWEDFDKPNRRQSSTNTGHPLRVSIPKASDYFATKPSPTTSTVLASGSVITPLTLNEKASHGPDLQSTHEQPRTKPLYIREGGSIPAIRFLEKEFGAPAAHLPCGQASDSAHLDNERLRLVNLYRSKDIFRKVFEDLPQK